MSDSSANPNQLVRCKCLWCGGAFWSDRSTAQYCIPAHKQKAYRWRSKITKLKLRAFKTINEMSVYLDYDQSTPAASLALQEIRTLIAETQNLHKVQVVK